MSSAATPRHALLPAAAIFVVAGVAWLGTILWARQTGLMPGTMGLSLLAFVVMWTLMMAAMMFPSAAPMMTLYARTLSTQRARRVTAFVAGYLLVWALSGIPAFAIAWLAGRIAMSHANWSVAAAAVTFAAAGVYQLSALRSSCLSHCRSPLAHLLHYGNYRGRLRDLCAGSHHGVVCLGCCSALMLLMIAFGVMNLIAMVALAVVIAVEKQWSHGGGFARLVGLACFGLALLVVVHPGLAPGLQGAMGAMGS